MKLGESTDRKHYCRFLFKILTVNFIWLSFRRQSFTFCWLMSNRSDWCNVALSPKAERELVGGKRHFLKPHLVVKLEEWWGDPASWVSAHSMSSSRPCRLGRCFPGPPTLDHRRCCTQHRRRCITRSSSRISPEKPFPLRLLLPLLLLLLRCSGCSQWRTAVTTSPSPTFGQQRSSRRREVSADPSNVLSVHPQQQDL